MKALRRLLRPLKRTLLAAGETIPDYITARRDSNYSFTLSDMLMHMRERTGLGHLPIRSQQDGAMQRVTIGKQTVFWPSGNSALELAGLYHEVFAPFSRNPSSYDHPAISWDRLKWVIDAGACEGYFSGLALQRGVPHVLAIEPLPALHPCLMKSFESEVREDRFQVEGSALGSTTGTIRLELDPQYVCTTRTSNKAAGVEIPVRTLDEIASVHGLNGAGLIKMDIEDAEVEAVKGARQLLRTSRPALALATYHSYENAMRCRDIILDANPEYRVSFRGYCGYFDPPRPYMLFAF